ncbi:MAG: (Fe-S)-binding protein, partial [candidate division Zixibacteria bacterium]|nr:(Fe-S)-binding protein [candidate division Zixibacteria bacterium]
MSEGLKKKPEEILDITYNPPPEDWQETKPEFVKGTYNYASTPDSIKKLDLPNPRKWQPYNEDWKLPENWQEIILKGLKNRLDRYRSLKIFMDICVRCGACADKCHFFLGSGDPKNMPVLRAELLRSVYKNDFTTAGKIMGKIAGARELTIDVLKEWFFYFYQCTECRRCSVFCPYGIDTAEITILARELLAEIGCTIDWITTPVANCYRTGNHLGIQPHGFKDSVEFAVDDLHDVTGIKVDAPINKKGAEVLFVVPSADYFADPHYFGFL